MGKLVMIEFLTLDGVMQGVGSPEEDTSGGFTGGGWGAPYAEGIHSLTASSGFGRTASYLFGRRTYEKMAAYWPYQPDTDPIAAHMNATPKYVATRTPAQPAWGGTTLLPGDATDSVARLKSSVADDIALLGSGVLGRALLAHGLVDQLKLFIHPLLLGSGRRLFGDLPKPLPLTLISTEQTTLGTVALVYRIDAPSAGTTESGG